MSEAATPSESFSIQAGPSEAAMPSEAIRESARPSEATVPSEADQFVKIQKSASDMSPETVQEIHK